MPRRDGSGPMGQGSMTGRGAGVCTGASGYGNGTGFGRGAFGCRRGFGFQGAAVNNVAGFSTEAQLAQEKTVLEKRLEIINEQLKEK